MHIKKFFLLLNICETTMARRGHPSSRKRPKNQSKKLEKRSINAKDFLWFCCDKLMIRCFCSSLLNIADHFSRHTTEHGYAWSCILGWVAFGYSWAFFTKDFGFFFKKINLIRSLQDKISQNLLFLTKLLPY